FASAIQQLTTQLSNPTQYWFAEKLAWHETGMSQFCESGRADSPPYCSPENNNVGWPILGPPAGYGLLQRDPLPTTGGTEMPSQIMWSWREAITSAKVEIDATAGPPIYSGNINKKDPNILGYAFWLHQVQQWNAYNAGQPAALRVAPP